MGKKFIKNCLVIGAILLFIGASFVPYTSVGNVKADFAILEEREMNKGVSEIEYENYSPWVEGIEYIPYAGQKDIILEPGVVYYEPDHVIVGTNDQNVLYWVVEVLQCILLERITELDPDSYLFELREDLTIDQFTEFLEGKIDFEYIEVNAMCNSFFIPNDPLYSEQWNLKQISCEKAWDKTRGSDDVVIAILDTGIDYNHPSAPYCIANGYDFVDNDWDSKDEYGHGTHCAGIAAAAINNGIGIAGVSNSCIMAVRVLDENGAGWLWKIALAIIWACDNDMADADVISMSLGTYIGPIRECLFRSACDYAYYFRDVLLVAAGGNEGLNSPGHPACYDSVIAVGAVDRYNEHPDWSNHGVELVAPGVNIFSTMPTYHVTMNDYPHNYEMNYDECSGTSMACPHVAGVAGLIYAKLRADGKNPRNWEVREILQETAKDLGSEDEYGYGLVDASAAVGARARNYGCYASLFLDFLQEHPNLFPILQILLKRIGIF